MNKKKYGKEGQDKARKYLEDKGMILIEENYTLWGGEIDLIMQDGEEIVFVEVKTRKKNNLVDLGELITYSQEQTLQKTADHWIQTKKLYNTDYRIDLVGVIGDEIEWMKRAIY